MCVCPQLSEQKWSYLAGLGQLSFHFGQICKQVIEGKIHISIAHPGTYHSVKRPYF